MVTTKLVSQLTDRTLIWLCILLACEVTGERRRSLGQAARAGSGVKACSEENYGESGTELCPFSLLLWGCGHERLGR